MIPLALLLALAAPRNQSSVAASRDPRTDYDVRAYRLDLRVDPAGESIAGWLLIEASALTDGLDLLRLDADTGLGIDEVRRVSVPVETADPTVGPTLVFEHQGARLDCRLDSQAARGERLALAIRYHASPGPKNGFDGFHWSRTPAGQPWIGTSMQGTGAQYWFPCKASYFHPEDKPDRTRVSATVPSGLYAVSNGRLLERQVVTDGWERFTWQHDYPIVTYGITLNVAPYEVVERTLELAGSSEPVTFAYYVLPQDRDKAALQFAQVPELLATFGEAFGPFPFPRSKFALVETSFWGMEHSTAVAYGNSFPAWCAKTGERDRYARRNSQFDYILVHEVAHEWWGNAVTAADWRDFWLHEGFATYAEGVYVEFTRGADDAATYWKRARAWVDKRGSLDRGAGSDSGQAYASIIYSKGAWVLHTLRTFVDDDTAWWITLREFQNAFRYRNATTDDFRAVLERVTERDWKRFFDEWFHGDGYPVVEGKVVSGEDGIRLVLECRGTAGTRFHLPLDVAWTADGQPSRQRVELAPGSNEIAISTEGSPSEVTLPSLARTLGAFDVRIVESR